MQTINIHEAKTQLSKYIDEVAAGQGIVIARAGRPVARLMPLEVPKAPRKLGLGQGTFSLPKNFNSLHAEQIQKMFEESEYL